MHRIAMALVSAAILSSCGDNKNNSGFELKGKLENSKGETLYLEKLSQQQPLLVDSATADENGNFEFTNYQPRIGFYRIKISPQNFAMLVLDSADKVMITGNAADLGNSYKAEGSTETKLFMEYNEITRSREMRLDSLNKAFQAIMETNRMDSRKMDSVSKHFEGPYNSIVNSANEVLVGKIKANTEKYASLMAIQALDQDKYADIYNSLDAGLSKRYANDRNVRMFHDMVQSMRATNIGQPAPDINLPSPEGQEIALSSLKGKVVLIDFWASWCGPCRKEMPNVVKAYSKYKNKGFEIYGVSLDQEKGRWVEAIKKDGITWPQVSDLKQWQSSVVRLYNIQGIPYTVLLDKQGNILAKNLRGEELDKKLAEVLQ